MPNPKIEANPYRVNMEIARLFSQEIVTFPLSAEQIRRSKTFLSNIALIQQPGEQRLTGDDSMRDWEILPEGMLNPRTAPYIHPEVLAHEVTPVRGFLGLPTKASRQYDTWKEQLLVPEERLMIVAVDTEGLFADKGRRPSFYVAPVLRDGFFMSEDKLLNLYTQWVRAPESNVEKNARLKMYVAMIFMKSKRHPEKIINARGDGALGITFPAMEQAVSKLTIRRIK